MCEYLHILTSYPVEQSYISPGKVLDQFGSRHHMLTILNLNLRLIQSFLVCDIITFKACNFMVHVEMLYGVLHKNAGKRVYFAKIKISKYIFFEQI